MKSGFNSVRFFWSKTGICSELTLGNFGPHKLCYSNPLGWNTVEVLSGFVWKIWPREVPKINLPENPFDFSTVCTRQLRLCIINLHVECCVHDYLRLITGHYFPLPLKLLGTDPYFQHTWLIAKIWPNNHHQSENSQTFEFISSSSSRCRALLAIN